MIDKFLILQVITAFINIIFIFLLMPLINTARMAEKRERLSELIKILVYAAEQIYGEGRGNEKLDFVIKSLSAQRINNSDVIRAMIEANVFMLKKLQA